MEVLNIGMGKLNVRKEPLGHPFVKFLEKAFATKRGQGDWHLRSATLSNCAARLKRKCSNSSRASSMLSMPFCIASTAFCWSCRISGAKYTDGTGGDWRVSCISASRLRRREETPGFKGPLCSSTAWLFVIVGPEIARGMHRAENTKPTQTFFYSNRNYNLNKKPTFPSAALPPF